MTQVPTGSNPASFRGKPSNDIYTVMVAIALATVAGTLAFVIVRCVELLGKPFPGI